MAHIDDNTYDSVLRDAWYGRAPYRLMRGDKLVGADEIAQYLFRESTVETRKLVYRWARRDDVPIYKFGRKLIASQKKLKEYFDALTNGHLKQGAE